MIFTAYASDSFFFYVNLYFLLPWLLIDEQVKRKHANGGVWVTGGFGGTVFWVTLVQLIVFWKKRSFPWISVKSIFSAEIFHGYITEKWQPKSTPLRFWSRKRQGLDLSLFHQIYVLLFIHCAHKNCWFLWLVESTLKMSTKTEEEEEEGSCRFHKLFPTVRQSYVVIACFTW